MNSTQSLETIALESNTSRRESKLYSCVQVVLHPIQSYRNVKEGIKLLLELYYGSAPCEGAFFIDKPRNDAPY